MLKQFKSHLEENVSADAIIDKLHLLVLLARYWFDSIFVFVSVNDLKIIGFYF